MNFDPLTFPNQADFVEQKLKLVEEINNKFPFLRGNFQAIPEYAFDGMKNKTIAGWRIIILGKELPDSSGKPTIELVFQEVLDSIFTKKVAPILKENKELKRKLNEKKQTSKSGECNSKNGPLSVSHDRG